MSKTEVTVHVPGMKPFKLGKSPKKSKVHETYMLDLSLSFSLTDAKVSVAKLSSAVRKAFTSGDGVEELLGIISEAVADITEDCNEVTSDHLPTAKVTLL